jgi:hypothetical protein
MTTLDALIRQLCAIRDADAGSGGAPCEIIDPEGDMMWDIDTIHLEPTCLEAREGPERILRIYAEARPWDAEP